jgi:hypothetical protein
MRKTIETTDAPELVIEVDGDLKLEGDDEMVVELECEDDDATAQAGGNRIVISCRSDATLTVPRHARISVKAVGGDAKIEEIEGPINLGPVGGDLRVSEVGPIDAHSVGGDCMFDECEGPVNVRSVGGDLRASGCAFGGGSLSVGGDVSIQLNDLDGESYAVNAGGDVSIEFPEGANARVEINDATGSRRVTLGDGSVKVLVNAGGDVSVSHEGGDEADLEVVVSTSVNDAMRDVERELSNVQRNLESMSREMAERFRGTGVPGWKIERAQAKAESASRKVEAKLRKHMAKLEERARRDSERAAQRAARAAARQARRSRPPMTPIPPVPPVPPAFSNMPFGAPPSPARRVTDDERLLILRMLQEKKISTEQADLLLAALDR